MNQLIKQICAAGMLAMFLALAPSPARAITVELAKKCRQMSFAAHPPVRAGMKKGDAAAQNKYYRDCIAKGGDMPDSAEQKPAAPPPQPRK